jgi:hypothetical protein
MSTVKLCEEMGKLIDQASRSASPTRQSSMQAKLFLTPRGGTPERDAILGAADGLAEEVDGVAQGHTRRVA